MANYQGSLQEWRRYIDERTRAVRDRKEGRSASVEGETTTAPPDQGAGPEGAVSDEVEAVLAKHKAIAEEINHPVPQAAQAAPPEAAVSPGPPMAAAYATPLPDPTVVEAAAMFARLPRHIQLLMRPASQEVAQNSYKSKFSETREELIRRLLDPQLTLEETARILNVCPTTVRRYTNRSLLKQERTQGNHRRFRLSDVLEFLEKHGVPAE